MPTAAQLKATNATNIRNKTAIGSVTRAAIANGIDAGYDYTDQQVATVGNGYNIAAYGASPTNTAAANTTAILAAVTAAENNPRGGVVYIPAGDDFLHNGNIPYSGKVAFRGAGRELSCLKSATAAPCFAGAAAFADFAATISGLRLEGNNIGTIGLKIPRKAHFKYEDLFITNFTQKGIELEASLIGEFSYVTVENCNIGCDGYAVNVDQPNLFNFNYCTWRLNKTRAVQFDKCAEIFFNYNEISGNGTDGNLETGCYKLTNASPLGEGVGFGFYNCWFEQNWGNYIDLREPIYPTTHIMSACTFQLGNPVHGAGHGLRVIGRLNANTVLLDASSLKEQSTFYDVYVTGREARVVKCPLTAIGTSLADEGAWIETIVTDRTNTDYLVPPLPVAANSSYNFGGSAQQLTATNGNVLGFRPGQPCTIAMRVALDQNGGRFSISRGTDTTRTWDIDFALNNDSQIRFAVSLFDSNGNYLSAFAGKTASYATNNLPLVTGKFFVLIVRYKGGNTANDLDILVNNTPVYNNGTASATGAFAGVATGGNVRIGRLLNLASADSNVDCLEFVNKYLIDSEAGEFYSNPEAVKSYEASVEARYRFLMNLNDDRNQHALSAPTPAYT